MQRPVVTNKSVPNRKSDREEYGVGFVKLSTEKLLDHAAGVTTNTPAGDGVFYGAAVARNPLSFSATLPKGDPISAGNRGYPVKTPCRRPTMCRPLLQSWGEPGLSLQRELDVWQDVFLGRFDETRLPELL